jgi:uncharacterized RmlC-like cupin family protein
MKPRIIRFPTVVDPSGGLTPFEWSALPFVPARVFLLHDVVQGSRRGGHAHHELEELIVAVSGSFTVTTWDESGPHHWTLNHADSGLYVPPMVWRHLGDFSGNAVAMVFASTAYDPADYIRSKGDFLTVLPEAEPDYFTKRAKDLDLYRGLK